MLILPITQHDDKLHCKSHVCFAFRCFKVELRCIHTSSATQYKPAGQCAPSLIDVQIRNKDKNTIYKGKYIYLTR